MKVITKEKLETLAAVHTHTHTHTGSLGLNRGVENIVAAQSWSEQFVCRGEEKHNKKVNNVNIKAFFLEIGLFYLYLESKICANFGNFVLKKIRISIVKKSAFLAC